jgi:hypothetical protein
VRRLIDFCGWTCPIQKNPQAVQLAEKRNRLSFPGRIAPEESAFSAQIVKKQIPRFARNDNSKDFFRSH